jgi:Leucine-rich repeat (LRR) protein
LKDLDLAWTAVKSIAPLKRCTQLERLNLAHTAVTNLSPLKKLKTLKWLNLEYSSVKDAQVGALKESLSNLKIRR